jgi:hypothetical protein
MGLTRLTTRQTGHLPGATNDVDVQKSVIVPTGFAVSGVAVSGALAG